MFQNLDIELDVELDWLLELKILFRFSFSCSISSSIKFIINSMGYFLNVIYITSKYVSCNEC